MSRTWSKSKSENTKLKNNLSVFRAHFYQSVHRITHNSFYLCVIILEESTAINMKEIPSVVEEGSVAEYVCVRNYTYPDPATVLWFVDDVRVDVNYVPTEDNYSSTADFYEWVTKSTLRLNITRTMNNKTVKCVLKNSSILLNEHNMNVMCKYLLVCTFQTDNLKFLWQSFLNYRIYQ